MYLHFLDHRTFESIITVVKGNGTWVRYDHCNKKTQQNRCDHGRKKEMTNQDVEKRSDDNGGISTHIRICNKRPQQRQHTRSPGPRIHILSCCGHGLTQPTREVVYKIRLDAIVCKSLSDFNTCRQTHKQIISP